MTRAKKLLYVDCFTLDSNQIADSAPSSMSIGYGITSSAALRDGFVAAGFELSRPVSDTSRFNGTRASRLQWVLEGYQRIADTVQKDRPDAIFIFHTFSIFPTEIRRILLDLGHEGIPIVGYTHGSHWDPTDSFRTDRYPGLEFLDLANLLVLDRLLFDSQYIQDVALSSIRETSDGLATRLMKSSRVTGLPVDWRVIQSHRSSSNASAPTVVFNHAPIPAKDPEAFVDAIKILMPRREFNVMFTRRFDPATPSGQSIAKLHARYPSRVFLGDDLTVSDYYDTLWAADIQVSTAHHETLGISTLEAMSAECFPVLPARGSYPEITNSDPRMLYSDADDLQDRLAYYLDHPAVAKEVGQAASTLAMKHDPGQVVPRVLDAVAEVLH